MNGDSITSVIAKIAFICAIVAIGSIVLYCLLVTVGMDFGIFVLLSFIFFVIAFLLGLISTVIVLFRFHLKSLVYSLLSIFLSLPVVFIGTEFLMAPNLREENKKNYSALYNMELLEKELKMYAQNHNGILPNAENWCDVLMKQNPELTIENFRHPQPVLLGLKGKCHIAFNKALGGKLLNDISQDTVLLFEADGDWNLNGTSTLLNSGQGEKLFIRILFVDGSTDEYWLDKRAIRKFKSKLGRAYMYYEEPSWNP